MKKLIRISFFIILISIFVITFFQIKVEKYRLDLIEKYDFTYLKKDRVRYTPFVLFFYRSKIFKQNKCYFKNINQPYINYELKNNISRKPNAEYYQLFNIEYNAYLMYCYYNIEELNCR